MTTTRRRFLGAAGLVGVGSLAGCVGSLVGGSGGDRLRLPSLDVGGSPGGKVVVNPEGSAALLDFFATWCAPCKSQMPELREVREQFPDLHMVSITTESDDAAIRKFWTKYDGEWPVAKDPDLAATQKYGARQMPTMVLVDAEGEEAWRHVGLSSAEDVAAKVREARN